MSETVKHRGIEIEIWSDSDSRNPRTEWDNLATMVCFHSRYSLGDENTGHDNDEDFREFLKSDEIAIVLPLYLYDHSGITMSTGAFSCRFDSGQVGVIYITKEKIRNEFGVKRISKKKIKEITKYLEGEVETYDNYLTGNVYGYTVEETDDSCGGYFGYNHEESGLLEEAKNSIDCTINNRVRAKIEKLKNYIKSKVPMIYRTLPDIV